MILNKIKSNRKDRGFTIVELLVVIVVIGILAAITILSYAGITARANSASSQAAANALISKSSAYQTESAASAWPTTFGAMTADSTKSYYVSGVSNAVGAAELSAQPASTSTVQFLACGVGPSAAATSYANLLTGTVTGVKVDYWKYDTPTGVQNFTAGKVYVSGSTFDTQNTYTISCWPSNS